MNANQSIIEKFYSAFMEKDYAEMIECYHPDIHFQDEVFNLHGKSAGAMWYMLCSRGKDLQVNYSGVEVSDNKGKAHWEATYTFSASGRKVHNFINAEFEFKDGKIIHHKDSFNFWKWSAMALGPAGLLLGWSSGLRRKVSRAANKSLEAFIEKHPEYR